MNDLSLVGDDQNSIILDVRSYVNQMIELIRLLLPDPLNRFDTTGIFVFGFLLVSISIHLLNILLSNTSGNSDILDKKTLHDCITRIKEQDVLIGKYKANEIHFHDLQAQCLKSLDMINEKDRKLEIVEGERERLREKISKMETNIRDLEDEKREISLKLKEYDQVVKKVKESNEKIEKKLYNEELLLNNRIRQLEEQLTKAQSINSANKGGLNMGVHRDENLVKEMKNSSGREFGQRSEFPSLWSDIDGNDIPYNRR